MRRFILGVLWLAIACVAVADEPQWSEIDPHVEPVSFHPEGNAGILVDVHQVVRDLNGTVLGDEQVGHRFTIDGGLIQAMEVCPLPPSSLGVERDRAG